MSTSDVSARSISTSADPATKAFNRFVELGGRILLSALFLTSGLGKIGAYAGTAAYMSSLGVPGAFLPAVIALEVFGAVAIIVGWQTKVTAFLLAGFTVLSALIFHSNFADQVQAIMFFKNISIAGGFLLLVASGAGALSIDALRKRGG